MKAGFKMILEMILRPQMGPNVEVVFYKGEFDAAEKELHSGRVWVLPSLTPEMERELQNASDQNQLLNEWKRNIGEKIQAWNPHLNIEQVKFIASSRLEKNGQLFRPPWAVEIGLDVINNPAANVLTYRRQVNQDVQKDATQVINEGIIEWAA
jgi:hypothetical protein